MNHACVHELCLQILSAVSKELSGFKAGICNIFSESLAPVSIRLNSADPCGYLGLKLTMHLNALQFSIHPLR